jgi:ADP-ribosylglycohydrolase
MKSRFIKKLEAETGVPGVVKPDRLFEGLGVAQSVSRKLPPSGGGRGDAPMIKMSLAMAALYDKGLKVAANCPLQQTGKRHAVGLRIMTKPSIARGALLGAFVGDASGATLEFLGRKPSNEDVETALSMVGGGCWRVAPGQITDDGELALCLTRSLAGAQAVDRDKVAEAYVDWFNSGPFDCSDAGPEGGSEGAPGPATIMRGSSRGASDALIEPLPVPPPAELFGMRGG